jgi:hypothetical protein
LGPYGKEGFSSTNNNNKLLPIILLVASAAAIVAMFTLPFFGVYFFFLFLPLTFSLPWSIKRLWGRKARIGDIVALQSRFNESELQVIGINSNDPNYKDEGFDNMLIFANEHKLNFPYLIDESQDVARAYGAVCTPDPFLFDADHRLVFHGRINDALEPEAKPTIPVMENNVRKLLRGERIEKDFDPSIGCSIKWKN